MVACARYSRARRQDGGAESVATTHSLPPAAVAEAANVRKGVGVSAGAESSPAWGDVAAPARREGPRIWIGVGTCAEVVSAPFDSVERAVAAIRGGGAWQ